MRVLLTILAVLFSNLITAQLLNGKVTDHEGNPLPYASVYLENSTYGVATNQKGEYQIRLAEGNHVLVVRFLGFETKEVPVKISGAKVTVDVQLTKTATDLMAAEVVGDTEDRAKEIMSKVRDARGTFKRNLESYSSDEYVKVTIEREFPDTSLAAIDDPSETSNLTKQNLILTETVGKLHYKRQSKYKEIIFAQRDAEARTVPYLGKSLSVSFEIDDNDIAPLPDRATNPYLIYTSVQNGDFDFYDNLISFEGQVPKPLMSPIANQSALSYKYDYLGSFYEDGKLIYEIGVTPLFVSSSLFQGVIFIESESYALHGVDLEIDPYSMLFCERFRIIQNYNEAEPGVFVPVRREITYTIKDGPDKVLGKVEMLQENFVVNQPMKPGFFNAEVQKYDIEAFERDSSYWEDIRPIQLNEKELDFIQNSDSIEAYLGSDAYFDRLDSAFNAIDWWAPLAGIGHRNRKRGNEWYIEGIPGQINPFGIGGYRHKLPGYFNKTFENNFLLETEGFIDYGFRNADIKGNIGVGLTYKPEKSVRTFVRVGDFYEMINTRASIEQIFSRSNYVRTRNYSIAQRMEIFNGLYGELTLDYADQIPLKDISFAVWSNELFGDLNEPSDFERYTKSEVRLDLLYRVGQKYVWKYGKKVILPSNKPVISMTYRKGVKDLFGSEVDFDFLEFAADHEWNIARWGKSHWRVSAGSFVNKKKLRLLEHKYFRGSDQIFFSDPTFSFQLLGPTLSTADGYFQANYHHHFNGTILGKIPFLNRAKIHLAAGTGTLLLAGEDFAHAEVYAGIERTFRIKEELFSFGLYGVTSDNNLEKASYTFKIGINFFNTFTNKWDY